MKDRIWQESGVMEKQIIAEENSPQNQQTPQTPPKKTSRFVPKINLTLVSAKLKLLKNRKLQVVVVLLLTLTLIFVAFLVLSKKDQKPAQQTSVKITIASPEPTPDSQLDEAKKEVSVFTSSLDSLDSELDSVKFPQIDLDIKF